ncbi:MAG: HDIG domain-containing protein [Clostridium sp.]|uniref:HDIG domain-containing metalloprotein n=1 Tax=Clostridium sp. TaxID=1506 RepID=UPI0025B7B77F|nr:HDIG domain-containing metalloprotein [Clostridium sp.]MCH3965477.1 HDIG domain-containing protein [Clostridium sp.]
MFFYRLKQFYWNLSSNLDEYDLFFLNHILNDKELKLFNRLSISEQKHSVKVAYSVEKMCIERNINSGLLIKAALLHDIGKIYKRLNIIDKSILVLLDKLTRGKMEKICNVSKISKIGIYYHHATLGADLLNKIGCDKYLIYLVKNHDNKNTYHNSDLDILKYCDNNN